jgi:biotin carboxylase
VPCPESFHVTELAEAWSAIRKLTQHTIVKPALSNGSQGVTRLPEDPTKGQVQAAFERAMQFTRADGVMVEQFIEGPEFSVEALTANGTTHVVAVTDKLTSEPYCVEIGHSQPSQWPEKDLAEIRTTAAAAVRALGIDWSASHTEIRLGPNGPRVIEVGARLGGGFITSHLVPLSTGVDMLGAAIGLALGETPCLRSTHCRGAAIRFLTPAPGIVQRIDGVDRCRNSIGVCEVVVEVKPGDRIKPLIDNSGRVGHVICDANTARDARHFAQRAADCISIETTATLAGVSPEAVNSV